MSRRPRPRCCPLHIRLKAEDLARKEGISFGTALRWLAKRRKKAKAGASKSSPQPDKVSDCVSRLEKQHLF